jgi:hypothetical protein
MLRVGELVLHRAPGGADVDKATLAIDQSVVRAEINDGIVYDRIGLLGGEPIRT